MTTIATGHQVSYHELPLDRRHTRRIVTMETFARAEQDDHRRTYDTLMVETCPVARAVLGHVPGDTVTVETGVGRKTVRIEGVGR